MPTSASVIFESFFEASNRRGKSKRCETDARNSGDDAEGSKQLEELCEGEQGCQGTADDQEDFHKWNSVMVRISRRAPLVVDGARASGSRKLDQERDDRGRRLGRVIMAINERETQANHNTNCAEHRVKQRCLGTHQGPGSASPIQTDGGSRNNAKQTGNERKRP